MNGSASSSDNRVPSLSNLIPVIFTLTEPEEPCVAIVSPLSMVSPTFFVVPAI